MKRFLLFMFPLVIAGVAFGVFLFFLTKNGINKGALQVTSTPKSKVYLNGVLLGETPMCKCDINAMLPTGDYTIRLEPEVGKDNQAFEQKITLNKATLTVVDRSFSGSTNSGGSVISLSKLSNDADGEFFFTSFPDTASVILDKSVVGETPLVLKNITTGDHDVTFQKNGYKEKTIKIHSVKGYRLTAITFLGVDLADSLLFPVSSSSASTQVGQITVTPTLTPKLGKQVVVLDTPTGFLRVRANPSLGASSSAEVKPGETYGMLDQKNGWTQITLSNGQTGWVSSQYVKQQ